MTYKALTTQTWLGKAQDNADVLRDFIANWHPSARYPQVAVDQTFPITAPSAERACQEVRQLIRKQEPADPVRRFDNALANGDVGQLVFLLEGAWFGVPESTACWEIAGFSLACDLLDDPPMEEETP